MDKSIYVAMTGARAAMQAQTAVSHNLANASSNGFRAVRQSLDSAPVNGPGFATRVNALLQPESWDNSQGSVMATGEALDVALQGEGWIAVQDAGGGEAYTRSGNFHLTPTGLLETAEGHVVLGTGGPVSIPQFASISIADDGQISIVPQGQQGDTVAVVNTIKLVNPPPAELERSADGLFRLRDGSAAPADISVRVVSGALEGSNVNATQSLVDMIALARHYELHVRTMKNAEENDQVSMQLMRMSG